MKKSKKIGVIGYFSIGIKKAGGQSIKTLALVRALRRYYPRQKVRCVPTDHWEKNPKRKFLQVLYILRICQALIMLPAKNSLKIFAPFLVLLGKPLGRKLLYVVIGGWLPEVTKRKKWLAYFLKKFDGIYVETSSMKTALEKQGFNNIFIMPNFKDLQILQEKDLVYTTKEPFAFCTFSRVMKEKGIEDAIEAITKLNTKEGRTVATLDIYGKIDDNYADRFNELQQTFPSYITYKGVVNLNQSVQTLKNYFALLFPTYYAGEGFAGTLLDAMAAGVPVIASDWKYNKEIVVDGKTGVIIKKSLFDDISKALGNISLFNTMKPLCLQEAQKYTPQKIISLFLEQLL